jgi:curved DNA-binding protein CbpA
MAISIDNYYWYNIPHMKTPEPKWPSGSKPPEFIKPTESTAAPVESIASPSLKELEEMWAQDFYARLGLDRNASKADIMGAYATLATKYSKDPTDTSSRSPYDTHYKLITEAYDTLSDPQRRSLYDSDLDFKEETNMELGNIVENVSKMFADNPDFIRAVEDVSEMVHSFTKQGFSLELVLPKIKTLIISNFVKYMQGWFDTFDVTSSSKKVVKTITDLQFHFPLLKEELVSSIEEIAINALRKSATKSYGKYLPEEAFLRTEDDLYKLIDAGFDARKLVAIVSPLQRSKDIK